MRGCLHQALGDAVPCTPAAFRRIHLGGDARPEANAQPSLYAVRRMTMRWNTRILLLGCLIGLVQTSVAVALLVQPPGTTATVSK